MFIFQKEISNLNDLLNLDEVLANKEHLETVCKKLSLLEVEVEKLYIRWNELDNKA